jgi:hypothetical protein
VNRKFLIAGGLAGVLAVGNGASVVMADFCADDPVIQVGNGQVVYLTDEADSSHLASLQAVKYRVLHTDRTADGTHVTLLLYFPNDSNGASFDVDYTVSTGPNGSGNVLAQGHTESGKAVVIQFVLHS